MKDFNGKVLFLDRSDINTDEIIPARYLTEVTKEALKPFLLEDLELEGFSQPRDINDKMAVVSRENFGCGSSREHAPWALEVNGIHVAVAENFARIFRQNMFNCGMLAIELSKEEIDKLFSTFSNRETVLTTDFEERTLSFKSGSEEVKLAFEITGFDSELVKAGGWVSYADKNY
ncbi:MAG: 3-isopropylmalate dehydratase small subunit [Spirochaetales bacterium]|nr:3-isopropylmalate dehydratase small subunit [Spirochaetales bacterium]